MEMLLLSFYKIKNNFCYNNIIKRFNKNQLIEIKTNNLTNNRNSNNKNKNGMIIINNNINKDKGNSFKIINVNRNINLINKKEQKINT